MELHATQKSDKVVISTTKKIPMEGVKSKTTKNILITTDSTTTSDDDEEKTMSIITSLLRTSPFGCFKNTKKLLVLDINGLLAHIVSPLPKAQKADAIIARRAIFKRPFYTDFLNFCFEKFEVAIWSSRTKKNIDMVIDYLMGNMKERLLFCWDASHCTETSFKTLENKYKPLVFKDLRKIWDKGFYNESNTLLLDDSPYKALLNPPHNSVFPHSFSFQNRNDNSLGGGGDLRNYVEGIANAESVNKYVEEHPFGQEPISERSQSWNFYLTVIRSLPAN